MTPDAERCAREIAAGCGVTRLADVTGLDRIGVPVWQAVRPRSRALSVHQGKGFDAGSARIGALMEAIESAHAESWCGFGPSAAWATLPARQRSAAPDDFARHRGTIDPDAPIAWAEADPLGRAAAFLVPEAVVSMDFTHGRDANLARSSNGLAAHFSIEAATRHALHEVIERDARGQWQRSGAQGRIGSRIAVETVPYAWFQDFRARLRTLGIALRVNRVPAVVPLAVFVIELIDTIEPEGFHAAAAGAGAHEQAEAALRSALLEAIQSRLTVIAGARDDLPLDVKPRSRRAAGLGFPTPALLVERPFPHDDAPPLDNGAAVDRLVAQLARAGYPQVGRLSLSPTGSRIVTVKVVVPGLGDLTRARRAPLPCAS